MLFTILAFSYSCGSSDNSDQTNLTDNSQQESVSNEAGSIESIPPGEFVRVADMKNARIQHSALLIEGGKVLVMGGKGLGEKTSHNTYIFDTAEIYDPGTDTWEFTGVMAIHRYAFASGLLPDGRVIVAGGRGTLTHAYPDAEIWDPATGEFESIAPMLEPRDEVKGAVLSDGRFLVSGGYNVNYGLHKTAEIYDPSSDTWTEVASMVDKRANHTVTVMQDGRVLITGGGK